MPVLTWDLPAFNVGLPPGGESEWNGRVSTADLTNVLNQFDDGNYGFVKFSGGGSGSLTPEVEGPMFAFAPLTLGGQTITNVELVAHAYRQSGGDHPSPNLSDPWSSATYPDLRVWFIGTGEAGFRIDEPLPFGEYGWVARSVPTSWYKWLIADYPEEPDPGFEGISLDVGSGPGDAFELGEHLVFIDYLAFRVTYGTEDTTTPPLRGYPRDDRLRGSIRGYPNPTSRQHSARATGYL